jgi:hypothetical protein
MEPKSADRARDGKGLRQYPSTTLRVVPLPISDAEDYRHFAWVRAAGSRDLTQSRIVAP